MSRMLLAVLVVLAVFTSNSYADVCGLNEEFNSCGSACEPSCARPNPKICTMQCVIGCQCKKGYWRHTAGHCVAPSEC